MLVTMTAVNHRLMAACHQSQLLNLTLTGGRYYYIVVDGWGVKVVTTS